MFDFCLGFWGVDMNEHPDTFFEAGSDGHLLDIEERDAIPLISLSGDRRREDSIKIGSCRENHANNLLGIKFISLVDIIE